LGRNTVTTGRCRAVRDDPCGIQDARGSTGRVALPRRAIFHGMLWEVPMAGCLPFSRWVPSGVPKPTGLLTRRGLLTGERESFGGQEGPGDGEAAPSGDFWETLTRRCGAVSCCQHGRKTRNAEGGCSRRLELTGGSRLISRFGKAPRARLSSKQYSLFVETESIMTHRLRDSKTVSVAKNETDPLRTFELRS